MEVFLECLPCTLRQAVEASRMATDDRELQQVIMEEAVRLLADFTKYKSSPELGRAVHQLVKKRTGVQDPYKQIKQDSIAKALQLYPALKEFLAEKQDQLYWALKIAVTGNTIDAAVSNEIEIKEQVEMELEKEFALCDLAPFAEELRSAKQLLLIGDNAGETVFDRILVEKLAANGLELIYAVRSEPIINDTTLAEAYASGLEQHARIVATGSNVPGLILEECTPEFQEIFKTADLILSKGQGNYETLGGLKRGIFFLLKAKCAPIAALLGVKVNDYVFFRS
ncbi:MAG: DUF89 family protein [Firmicutes bacterium]|nr:DUF89 family protein [Bacillota bacterium]